MNYFVYYYGYSKGKYDEEGEYTQSNHGDLVYHSDKPIQDQKDIDNIKRVIHKKTKYRNISIVRIASFDSINNGMGLD